MLSLSLSLSAISFLSLCLCLSLSLVEVPWFGAARATTRKARRRGRRGGRDGAAARVARRTRRPRRAGGVPAQGPRSWRRGAEEAAARTITQRCDGRDWRDGRPGGATHVRRRGGSAGSARRHDGRPRARLLDGAAGFAASRWARPGRGRAAAARGVLLRVGPIGAAARRRCGAAGGQHTLCARAASGAAGVTMGAAGVGPIGAGGTKALRRSRRHPRGGMSLSGAAVCHDGRGRGAGAPRRHDGPGGSARSAQRLGGAAAQQVGGLAAHAVRPRGRWGGRRCGVTMGAAARWPSQSGESAAARCCEAEEARRRGARPESLSHLLFLSFFSLSSVCL